MTAETSGSRPVQFSKNALWNMIGQGSLAVLALVCTPYLIRNLGTEGYALYCLLGLTGGYLMLMAFAAAPATVKYVAELHGGDNKKLSGVLGAALFMHTVGVALGALLVFQFIPFLAAEFFKIESHQLRTASFVLTCAVIAAPLTSLLQYGVSMLQGLQRYDRANQAQMAQSGLVLGGAVVLIFAGGHLRAIAVFYITVQALAACWALFTAFRLLKVAPAGAFRTPEVSATSKKYVRYALVYSISAVTYMVAFQFDKLFIGAMLPISQLSYYLVPSAIMQKFGIIPVSIAVVTLPMFSRLQSQGDHEAGRRIYRKCSQMILWLVVPGFAVLMVIAPQFLTLWLGEEFSRHGTWPMRLLLAGYFVYFLMALPANASAGVGQIKRNNIAGVSLSILCCLFWTLLIPRYGIAGAAWGFFLAQTLSWLPFIFWVNSKLFGLSAWSYVVDVCLKPFTAGAILLGGLWLCRHEMYTWPSLFVFSGAGAAAYFGASYWMLDRDVKENVQTVLGAVKTKVRGILRAVS